MKICHVLAKMSFHFHPILLSFISKNVYTFFCVCGTCIKCKTRKTQRCKEKGHSRIQRTSKRTLMREKEENTVLLHDKKNDIKLNAPAWSVNPESWTGGGLVNNNILSYKTMLLIVLARYAHCHMTVTIFSKTYVLYRSDVVHVAKVTVVWIY